MKEIKLNTGLYVPMIGFGTYEIAPNETKQAVLTAIEVGYRHIDTAQYYQNEREVGPSN